MFISVSQWWERFSERLSWLSLSLSLVALVLLTLGAVLGRVSPMYSLATSALLALVLLLLLRQDEVLAALVVAVHVLVDSYLNFDTYQIALLMTLLLLVICYLGRAPQRPWHAPRLTLLWLLFLLLNIYPTIDGGVYKLSNAIAFYLNVVLSAFLMFWLGNLIARNYRAVQRVFQVLAALAALIALHTIIQAVTGVFLFETPQAAASIVQAAGYLTEGYSGVARAGSFLGNPDGNGVFLATSFFLPLGLLFSSKRWWVRLIYLSESLLILGAIACTYSNASWIAVILGVGIFCFLVARLRTSLLLLFFVVAMLAAVLAFFPGQASRQLQRVSQGDVTNHLATWQTAERVIEAYPLFGVGLGDYAYLIRSDPYRVFAQDTRQSEPDMSYLQWGAMSGLPTMLVFVLLLGSTFLLAWRNWRVCEMRYRPLLGAGIVALLALSVNSLAIDGWTNADGLVNLGWLIAGLVTSPLLAGVADRTISSSRSQRNAPVVGVALSSRASKSGLADQDRSAYRVIRGRAAEQTDSSAAQGYLALALDLVKSSGLYALGSVASPLVSLILTPFLTYRLSSTNYGALAVLSTVVDLVTVITQLGLNAAFFRAYNGDYETRRDRLAVLAASIMLLVLVSVPLTLGLILAAPWISLALFSSQAFSDPVKMTALVILMENLTLPAILWLRVEKRVISYAVLSTANLLLILVSTLLLVGGWHLDINGALLAKGLGYAVFILYTFPIMLYLLVRQRSPLLRPDVVRSLLSFGIPSVFSSIASWILQLSDRYLLSRFASLAQTARYSVAYTLGGVLTVLLIGPFILAWNPLVYLLAKRADATRIFPLVFRWFSLLLLFATFALSLLSIVVLKLFFPPDYQSAILIIPIIALSTMFIGVYYIFVVGVNICRKASFIVLFTAIAALVNIICNLFMIPLWGAMGAALATLIAYIALILITYLVAQRLYPLRFEVGHFVGNLLVGILLYVGGGLLALTQAPWLGWCITIGALLLYGVFLLSRSKLSRTQVKQVLTYLRQTLTGKKLAVS